jgi:hypothetical protein
MKTGIGLQELAKKIEEQSQSKRDFLVDTQKLEMKVVESKAGGGKPLPQLFVPDHGEFPLRPLAHDQLGEKLGIPSKYYDRLLTQEPQLLATNVNTWLHRNPERRMVRTMEGHARAFLSDRYQRIDNHEVAEVALPALMELPDVKIVSSEITERRLYIHFVVPTIQGEVKRGDVVQAGGIISNSEVGLGSVSVASLLWRLICLNGMKGQEAYRRHHVGRKTEDTGEIDWADDTRAADDKAVLLKVRDMVRAVVDDTRFQANLKKLQGLTEGKIVGNPTSAVEVLAQKLEINQGEKGGILRALIEGSDLSRWGIINAVTAQAHDALSYDRAVDFETMGGKLVDLPIDQWKEVLEAA